MPLQNREYCSVVPIGKPCKTKHLNYQQNFTITCKNGTTSSVPVRCIAHGHGLDIPPANTIVQGKLNNCHNLATYVYEMF